jgi:protein SCO1/2
MSRNHAVVIAIVAIVAATAGVLLARSAFDDARLPQAAMTAGTLLEPPRPLPTLTLVDQAEQPFTLERLRNRWTLLFFGFTNCPDVCPATMGVMKQIEASLQDLPAARRPQIVLVSVDPERDTPQQLASYVKFFSPSFTGVTGTQDAIGAFTRAMGVPVAISKRDGNYSVDHSAAMFLIDPGANLRALFSTPHEPAKIGADYRRIVARQ